MNSLSDIFVIRDGLDAFLIGAFLFGLVFSALSLLLGAADIGGAHFGHVHAGGHGHGHGHGHTGHQTQEAAVAVVNISTVLAFITWFGGIGFLLRNALSLPAIVGLGGGVLAGVIGAWIVLKVLVAFKRQERYLDAARERLGGAIGRVTTPIRDGGTGEITYELNGVRQVSAARAPAGTMLPRGAEVIVVRRERGIAFVEASSRLDPDHDWERRFQLGDGDGPPSGPPGSKELMDHRTTR
jgi:membrane protein implicated in regulation of membrane protease activity